MVCSGIAFGVSTHLIGDREEEEGGLGRPQTNRNFDGEGACARCATSWLLPSGSMLQHCPGEIHTDIKKNSYKMKESKMGIFPVPSHAQ